MSKNSAVGLTGCCEGRLAGLIVWLFHDDEPDCDPAWSQVFLSIQLKRRVVAVLEGGLVDYDNARRFVLRETGDGTFRGEVAAFHAVAEPIDDGRWRLTLSDGEPAGRELSLDDVSRRLHDEPGGDI